MSCAWSSERNFGRCPDFVAVPRYDKCIVVRGMTYTPMLDSFRSMEKWLQASFVLAASMVLGQRDVHILVQVLNDYSNRNAIVFGCAIRCGVLNSRV